MDFKFENEDEKFREEVIDFIDKSSLGIGEI